MVHSEVAHGKSFSPLPCGGPTCNQHHNDISSCTRDVRDVHDVLHAHDVPDVRDVLDVRDVHDVLHAHDVPDVRDVLDVRDVHDVLHAHDVPDVRDVLDVRDVHDVLHAHDVPDVRDVLDVHHVHDVLHVHDVRDVRDVHDVLDVLNRGVEVLLVGPPFLSLSQHFPAIEGCLKHCSRLNCCSGCWASRLTSAALRLRCQGHWCHWPQVLLKLLDLRHCSHWKEIQEWLQA
eukprot:Skav226083  [mRNA]  locus=scaffold211:1034430:1035122:+ [translate_table: standard]